MYLQIGCAQKRYFVSKLVKISSKHSVEIILRKVFQVLASSLRNRIINKLVKRKLFGYAKSLCEQDHRTQFRHAVLKCIAGKVAIVHFVCSLHFETGAPHLLTFALSRSMAFMREPWKYLTLVCCLFSSPSNSKSGSALKQKI